MNINVLFFNLQTTLACNLKRKRKTRSKSPLVDQVCLRAVLTSQVTGLMSNAQVFGFVCFFLPVCAPVVCDPEDLTGALAPGTHHTAQCFCDSGSRAW